MSISRSIERIIPATRTIEGGGFVVHRPFPTRLLMDFDPFLLLDEMGPADYAPGEAKGAPDHPHRGFETVTYMLEGEFGHKDFKRAIDKTIAATKKHKKALGRLVPTVEQGVELYGQGFDFVCYSGDVWVLHNALADAIGKLREGTAAMAKKKG